VIAAVCDLWSNEAVEYHDMFGATTTAVFAEILGYDAAAMNASIDLGYQKEFQACLVNSDKYRGPHGFMLSPDNAWLIGKAVVDNNESLYARGKAAAIKCGELMLGDPKLRLTQFERESLMGYMKDMEKLPAKEEDFIDMCLKKYAKVKGFNPAAYGL
jgi:methanol--5-hydroxybenzimidazolylcobamide Co-methyltransferase